jgi:hypothetical protein
MCICYLQQDFNLISFVGGIEECVNCNANNLVSHAITNKFHSPERDEVLFTFLELSHLVLAHEFA